MFRSGSPRPLSKPRNTFTLYSTPLTRAVRPLCSIRRLARHPSASVDLVDVRNQWEKHISDKPTEDVRFVNTKLANLYKNSREKKTLVNLFPLANEIDQEKTFDDYLDNADDRKSNDNDENLPIRFPKLQEDSSDFYVQFTQNVMSIMKKRPYESNENSNDGKRKLCFLNFCERN